MRRGRCAWGRAAVTRSLSLIFCAHACKQCCNALPLYAPLSLPPSLPPVLPSRPHLVHVSAALCRLDGLHLVGAPAGDGPVLGVKGVALPEQHLRAMKRDEGGESGEGWERGGLKGVCM